MGTSSGNPEERLSPQGLPVASRFANTSADHTSFKVLIVDADDGVRRACSMLGQNLGFAIEAVDTFATAQKLLLRQHFDLLLLDIDLSSAAGKQQLESFRASHPETYFVIVSPAATVPAAVEAMRLGASDFLTTPLAMDELTQVIERVAKRTSHDLQTRAAHRHLTTITGFGGLVGRSPAMEKLYRIVTKVAFTKHPVLILGASGTGKELVARTIHGAGPHAGSPFVPVYCNTLTPETIERELFGFAKGAFPGATRARAGLLVEADSGTVFFDGIGELPLELQGKLVRVLQEREVRPIGSHDAIPVQARIMASSDQDLTELQNLGKFRRDLFFRLNIVNIRVPSLTERQDDIPLLANDILRRIRTETGIPYELDTGAFEKLRAYNWPGNVRELEGALQRACVMASSPFLSTKDLPSQLQQTLFAEEQTKPNQSSSATGSLKIESIAELEKQAILQTIQQLRGDKLKAAKLLGIGKTTLYRKLKEYGIELSEGS